MMTLLMAPPLERVDIYEDGPDLVIRMHGTKEQTVIPRTDGLAQFVVLLAQCATEGQTPLASASLQ